jgi:hypothetical protein
MEGAGTGDPDSPALAQGWRSGGTTVTLRLNIAGCIRRVIRRASRR